MRSDAQPIDYHAEKARLTRAQADTAEIELARARAEVVNVAQVERNLANLFAEVRTNLRNIPARVASTVTGQPDERAVKRLLLGEIDLALDALAASDVVVEPSADDGAAADGAL